jgi:hypothetical protein
MHANPNNLPSPVAERSVPIVPHQRQYKRVQVTPFGCFIDASKEAHRDANMAGPRRKNERRRRN